MKWVSMHRRCRSKAGNWLRAQTAGGGAAQRLQEVRGGERGVERCGACGAGRGGERGAECSIKRSALLLRSQTARIRAMLCAIILLFVAFICSYAQTSAVENAWGAPAATPTSAATPASSAPAVPRVLNGNGTLVASALTFGDSSLHVNLSLIHI